MLIIFAWVIYVISQKQKKIAMQKKYLHLCKILLLNIYVSSIR